MLSSSFKLSKYFKSLISVALENKPTPVKETKSWLPILIYIGMSLTLFKTLTTSSLCELSAESNKSPAIVIASTLIIIA